MKEIRGGRSRRPEGGIRKPSSAKSRTRNGVLNAGEDQIDVRLSLVAHNVRTWSLPSFSSCSASWGEFFWGQGGRGARWQYLLSSFLFPFMLSLLLTLFLLALLNFSLRRSNDDPNSSAPFDRPNSRFFSEFQFHSYRFSNSSLVRRFFSRSIFCFSFSLFCRLDAFPSSRSFLSHLIFPFALDLSAPFAFFSSRFRLSFLFFAVSSLYHCLLFLLLAVLLFKLSSSILLFCVACFCFVQMSWLRLFRCSKSLLNNSN